MSNIFMNNTNNIQSNNNNNSNFQNKPSNNFQPNSSINANKVNQMNTNPLSVQNSLFGNSQNYSTLLNDIHQQGPLAASLSNQKNFPVDLLNTLQFKNQAFNLEPVNKSHIEPFFVDKLKHQIFELLMELQVTKNPCAGVDQFVDGRFREVFDAAFAHFNFTQMLSSFLMEQRSTIDQYTDAYGRPDVERLLSDKQQQFINYFEVLFQNRYLVLKQILQVIDTLQECKLDQASTSRLVQLFIVGDKRDNISTNNILAFHLLAAFHDTLHNIAQVQASPLPALVKETLVSRQTQVTSIAEDILVKLVQKMNFTNREDREALAILYNKLNDLMEYTQKMKKMENKKNKLHQSNVNFIDTITQFYNRISSVTSINITLQGLNINETHHYLSIFNDQVLYSDLKQFFEFWILNFKGLIIIEDYVNDKRTDEWKNTEKFFNPKYLKNTIETTIKYINDQRDSKIMSGLNKILVPGLQNQIQLYLKPLISLEDNDKNRKLIKMNLDFIQQLIYHLQLSNDLSHNLIIEAIDLLGSITTLFDKEISLMFQKILKIGYKFDFTKIHQFLLNSFKFDICNLMLNFDVKLLGDDSYFVGGIELQVDKKILKNLLAVLMEIAQYLFSNTEDTSISCSEFIEKYINLNRVLGEDLAPIYLLIDFQEGLFKNQNQFLKKINDGHIQQDNFVEFPIMAKFSSCFVDINLNDKNPQQHSSVEKVQIYSGNSNQQNKFALQTKQLIIGLCLDNAYLEQKETHQIHKLKELIRWIFNNAINLIYKICENKHERLILLANTLDLLQQINILCHQIKYNISILKLNIPESGRKILETLINDIQSINLSVIQDEIIINQIVKNFHQIEQNKAIFSQVKQLNLIIQENNHSKSLQMLQNITLENHVNLVLNCLEFVLSSRSNIRDQNLEEYSEILLQFLNQISQLNYSYHCKSNRLNLILIEILIKYNQNMSTMFQYWQQFYLFDHSFETILIQENLSDIKNNQHNQQFNLELKCNSTFRLIKNIIINIENDQFNNPYLIIDSYTLKNNTFESSLTDQLKRFFIYKLVSCVDYDNLNIIILYEQVSSIDVRYEDANQIANSLDSRYVDRTLKHHKSFNSFYISLDDKRDNSLEFKAKLNKIFIISIINSFENKDFLKSGNSRMLDTKLSKYIELLQMVQLTDQTLNVAQMAKYDVYIPREVKDSQGKDLNGFNHTFRQVILQSIEVARDSNQGNLQYQQSKGLVFLYAQVRQTMLDVCAHFYQFSIKLCNLELDKPNLSKQIQIATKQVNENCESLLELFSQFDKVADGILVVTSLNFFQLVISFIKNLSTTLLKRSQHGQTHFAKLTENTISKFARALGVSFQKLKEVQGLTSNQWTDLNVSMGDSFSQMQASKRARVEVHSPIANIEIVYQFLFRVCYDLQEQGVYIANTDMVELRLQLEEMAPNTKEALSAALRAKNLFKDEYDDMIQIEKCLVNTGKQMTSQLKQKDQFETQKNDFHGIINQETNIFNPGLNNVRKANEVKEDKTTFDNMAYIEQLNFDKNKGQCKGQQDQSIFK